jgi:predicted HNH restriction endonuclease
MVWSEKEIEYLRNNYPSKKTLEEISKKLSKSIKAIKQKAARENLSRGKAPHNKPKDKNHRKKVDKRYYINNRNEILKKRRERIELFRIELKKSLGGKCKNCGYHKNLHVLDFHHMRDKEETLSRLIKNESRQKALKESKKCILLCANCHREIHNPGL